MLATNAIKWPFCVLASGRVVVSSQAHERTAMASSRIFLKAVCMRCSADFLAREANVARGMGKFCSRSCAAKARVRSAASLEVLKLGHAKGPGKRVVAKAWRASHPEKFRAHLAVGRAVKTGKLTRLPCEVCGDVNSQGHHEDYSRPLEVMWLCQKHHSARHMEMERIDEQTLQLQARG